MNSSLIDKLELLGRLAEIKRIYSVIESSLDGSACIVVTSGTQGEGKTTVAAGLAVVAASGNGNRVLVVDYNWHAPALHEYFGVDLTRSVTEHAKGVTIDQLVQPTGIENLHILPAFNESNNEGGYGTIAGLDSEILKKAKEEYNIVIVDTSSPFPINHKMVDPVSISKLSDGVVLVTLTNVTPRQELKRACTAIETAGANILGVVANQWRNPIR